MRIQYSPQRQKSSQILLDNHRFLSVLDKTIFISMRYYRQKQKPKTRQTKANQKALLQPSFF